MSSRPNMPYRPRLCSHDVFKTDIERQAPDTWHQAPYIPNTYFVCVTIRRRHLDLTISWCEDSGWFPPEVSEAAAWNPMVRPSPKWWSTTTDRSDFNVHLLSRRRISVLSHVSRLDDDTPANVALRDDDDGDRVRVKYGGRCPQWLISGGRYPRGANVIHSSSSLRDLYGSSRTCDSAARRRRVASRRVTCINHRLIFDIVSHLRVAPERGADRCARQ